MAAMGIDTKMLGFHPVYVAAVTGLGIFGFSLLFAHLLPLV
jgi:hypothetical protein